MTRSWKLVLVISLAFNLLLPLVGWRAWSWRRALHDRQQELLRVYEQRERDRDEAARRTTRTLVRTEARVDAVLVGASITRSLDADEQFARSRVVVVAEVGETSARILAHFARDVLPLRPRVVYLAGDGGTNRFYQRGPEPAELEGWLQDQQALIRLCREAGSRVILGEVLPTHTGGNARAAAAGTIVAEANRRLAALASPPEVTLLPLAGLLGDADGRLKRELSDDGLHPNPQGQAVLAGAVRHALAAALADSPVPPAEPPPSAPAPSADPAAPPGSGAAPQP